MFPEPLESNKWYCDNEFSGGIVEVGDVVVILKNGSVRINIFFWITLKDGEVYVFQIRGFSYMSIVFQLGMIEVFGEDL